MTQKVWAEKYSPNNIKEYIFQNEEVENFVKSLLEEGDLPNMIVAGIQGSGKTTLVRILLNELNVDPQDIKTFNASSVNGIDNIRDNVEPFCRLFPNGKFKVVVLEEADGLSTAAQKALRNLMDKSAESVRFVFTCNYPHKIIPPIHSRSQEITLDEFDMGKMLLHVADILKKENVTFEGEILVEYVKKYHPDLRKTIQAVQQGSYNKEKTLKPVHSVNTDSGSIDEWESAWENPTLDKLLPFCDNINNTNFEEFYRVAYEGIKNMSENLQTSAYISIAEYSYMAYTVAFQPMNMRAFLLTAFEE